MSRLTWPVALHGPVVELFVTVSTSRAKVLRKRGLAVPPGVVVPAPIDTGATGTIVDEGAIKPLGLEPTGVASVRTAGKSVACNQFDAYLAIPDTTGFNVGDGPILSVDFSEHPIKALIGRDVLSRCTLVYDGRGRTVTLEY